MMKKVITRVLAFAAVLLCGGAWAVVPKADAVFTSFTDGATVKGSLSGATYTLSIGSGNSVNADGQIEIGTGSQVGAKITADRALGTKMTILVKYAAMPVSDSAVVSIFEDNDAGNGKCYPGARWRSGTATDLVGFYEDNQARTYYFSSGGGGADNSSPDPQTGAGYLLFSYDLGAGTGCYAGSSLNSLAGGYLTGLKFGSRQNYGFAVGGPYTDSYYPACAGMKIEKIAVFLGQYHTGTSVTNYAQFDWPIEVGDSAVWSNLDSTENAVTHFTVGSGRTSQMILNLQNKVAAPVGSVVSISSVKIANTAKSMADKMVINGVEGVKGDAQSATFQNAGTTMNTLYVYNFSTPVDVVVGTNYEISWMTSAGAAATSQVSGIFDNSPISITNLSSPHTGRNGFCSVEGVIKSFPTLPDTISYTTGDPSDWQSTGVAVAQADEITALKEIANRYTFAATFGNTSMDASPRDGTPLNVTLHSDGVLTVEMQVTNGGYKKAALIGFTIDEGLLKVKRIKSTYANTSFNGPMMTYSNGNVTKASGVNDGSYILANVTLTRTTKFKDDAVEPDFLSTTAPIIRYDASKYDNFTYNENGEVESWKDLSASGNNAMHPSGNTTKGRVEIVNGVPAYEMGAPGSGIDLAFTTRATDIRTVFWVMDIRTDGNKAFFLGDVGNDCYDFHRGEAGQYYASQHASNNVKNGTTYCDGSVVTNPTGTTPPAGLHVYALKTTGNVSANRLSQDRTQARNGGRAISELVVFNTALTDEQIAAMNKYLLYKWMGIETGEISATLPDGSQNFSEIAWNDGGKFANGKDVTLAVDSTTTLTIDEEALIGSLTLTGAGTLTINNAQNLSFGSVDISGFTGTINYNVDATRSAFTASEGLKALMKSGTDNMTFTFTGSGSNGATVDYGSTQDETTDVIFSCHIVFNGGTHALKYVHEKAGSKFGANATAANPTFLVTNNATLTFTGKNWCGWESGAVNANGIIRVNSGSTLNASTDNIGTFYWAQQFYLEPGSTTNFRSNNQSVRFNGGISESAPQIYVPECTADKANKIATVNLANSENLDIINQGTRGSAFFVGANATLKIGGNLICNENFTKYGDGILQITGNVTNSGTKTIAAGLYDIGAMRDFTTPGWTVSGTGGFLIHETSAEYAKADLTVTNPNNYTIKVVRPNGSTVYDLATVVADTTIKISGAATSFDVTYTNTLHEAYSSVAGFSSNSDGNNTCTYNITPYDAERATEIGAYLKHQPHLMGLDASNGFYESTDVLTFAIVGTMPTTSNTIFAHFGHTASDRYGLLLITGTKKDDVLVAYNHGSTVTPITTMSVPNAAAARHVYIVTKEDDRVNDTTTFTVYLDGQKWKTLEIDHRFMIVGNVQLGGDFWGRIRHDNIPENPYEICKEGTGGVANCVRGYNRIISAAEIAKYSEVYHYSSPNGASERTFEATADWIDTTEGSTVWTNTPAEGEATQSGTPLAGAAIVANLTEDTAITVNVPADGLAYESFNIKGTGSVTFEKGEDSGSIRSTGMVTIGRPVTVKPGSFDLSTPPITLLQDGDLTFDYSGFDVSEIYVTTKINLTGQIDQNDAKVHFSAPTSLPYRTATMTYDSSIKQYVLTITPNHEDGADVYLNSAAYFDGSLDGKVDTTLDGTTKTAVFPNDTVVFAEGKTLPAWVGKPQCSKIKIAKDVTLGMGLTSDADHTAVAPALDGVTITVDTGKTLTLNNADRSWSFASVTMNGPGAVLVKGTVSATAIAGNATLKLAEGATLSVGTELAVGRVVSNVSGKSVKKEEVADNKTKYSLIDTSTDPIEPSDNPEAEPVVIEDVGTGIAVQPNAKVEIALPEGATTEQKAEIAAKITVKYGETVLNPAEGTKYVSVTIGDDGAVNVDTTTAAKPTVTEMTEEGESAVSISFTPVPGLFYTLESGDTPNDFTPGDAEQATSSDTKTLQLSVPTRDAKVKFYRVRVKATK